MFDNLSKGMSKAWDAIRLDGKLTEENIKDPMKQMRRALLEADVSLPVVRRFVSKVEAGCLGVKVMRGLNPEQQLVKIVYDQLVELMGSQKVDLNKPPLGPQVVLMAGLQGTGKTTVCGKLAYFLKTQQERKVLLVATDVYRPAAVDQLIRLGERVEVEVFNMGTSESPVEIAKQGVKKARAEKYDTVIVDTAGRLQIDEGMMDELRKIKEAVNPTDTLLVVDSMTGQEAANLTKSFNDQVGVSGAVLTKTDGDSRGGASLTVREISGQPIKFLGTGEGLDQLEPFYPDRMAKRILNMGDMLSLVEKAASNMDEDEMQRMQKRIMQNKFDLDDFLKQYKMLQKMGNMGAVVKMMPGGNQVSDKKLSDVERELELFSEIIESMEAEERTRPEILIKEPKRRRRICRDRGCQENDVQKLLAMYTQMRSQMKTYQKMLSMGASKGMMGMPQLSDQEMMDALMNNSQRSVAPGTVRRKKKKALSAAASGPSKGFGKK